MEDHGGVNLKDIPDAVIVKMADEESETRNATSKSTFSRLKVHEHDSSQAVISKLHKAVTRIETKYQSIEGRKTVTKYHWRDIGNMLKQLFEENSDWLRLLQVTALAETDNWELFDMRSRIRVDIKDVANWVDIMWRRRSIIPLAKNMSELTMNNISIGNEGTAAQFEEAFNMVRRHLGEKTEVLLPVRLDEDQPAKPAMVDITTLLATLKLTEAWYSKPSEFWTSYKEQGVDQFLFPNSFCDEPLKALTLISKLRIVDKNLRSEAKRHYQERNSPRTGNEISYEDFLRYQQFVAKSFLNYGADISVMTIREQ